MHRDIEFCHPLNPPVAILASKELQVLIAKEHLDKDILIFWSRCIQNKSSETTEIIPGKRLLRIYKESVADTHLNVLRPKSWTQLEGK